MRIEKIIFCQPIIIRSIWFSITYCDFEFLEAFLFFSNGSSKVYFYFRFKLTFLDFSFIWTCGALYHKKIYVFNSYRIPINLFWTIEVPRVCLCDLTGEILIVLVCQIFASCVTSKAWKFGVVHTCFMTVSSFQINSYLATGKQQNIQLILYELLPRNIHTKRLVYFIFFIKLYNIIWKFVKDLTEFDILYNGFMINLFVLF